VAPETSLSILTPEKQSELLFSHICLNSQKPTLPLLSTITIHASTTSIFDIRQCIEDDVSSGVPISLGVRVQQSPQTLQDPALIFIFGRKPTLPVEVDGRMVDPGNSVLIEEVEFGKDSSVPPYRCEYEDNEVVASTDLSKERVELAIPLGLAFRNLDSFGERFRAYMEEWTIKTNLGDLRKLFLQEFAKLYGATNL